MNSPLYGVLLSNLEHFRKDGEGKVVCDRLFCIQEYKTPYLQCKELCEEGIVKIFERCLNSNEK